MQPNRLISGRSVTFKLKDAACPDWMDTARSIGPELQVTGEIVFFSDGGDRKNEFAIIEVAGIHTPLIVPVERLTAAAQMAEEQPCEAIENSSRKAS